MVEAAEMIKGVPKEVEDMKDALKKLQHDEDNKIGAATEEDKKRVNQLIEAAFRMEDIIDEYLIIEEQGPCGPGCAALPDNFIKAMSLRLQIAYKIQEAPLYMEEGDFVGFEAPTAELIDWLENGKAERTVIVVVGMGGQGKTTLVKKVFDFDNKKMIGNFDHCAWITVSQDYTVEGLLKEFYKQKGADPPERIFKMDRRSLINEVRNYLQQGRYVIVFDDVWNINFWDEIEFALVDKKNQSRIMITTRILDVAMPCKKSSFVQLHHLKPLTKTESLDLFYKKAFFNNNGCCPENLRTISSEIVEKCKGLPLAIVAIGGVLAGRENEDVSEWEKFSQKLSIELEKDSRLDDIRKILSLSYNDLPYHLRPCLLYFGMYPEDYKIKSKRLIRQWIAEGFVKGERGMETLEKVAEGYLKELIRRSLVQKKIPEYLVRRIPIKYKLKVLDFEGDRIDYVPENLGNLLHLKYLSFRGSSISSLPKSIGKLQNLETLDIRNTYIYEKPKEISRLRKLRHLLCHSRLCCIQLKDGIGSMTSLQTLKKVEMDEDGGEAPVRELGKLSQLRELSLDGVKKVHRSALCSSISGMQHLETLHIVLASGYGAFDFHVTTPPPMLRKLHLHGKLNKLPQWIPELRNLVKLTLSYSHLTDDPLKSLKDMPSLLFLSIISSGYIGNSLHFQDGGFQKLEELYLEGVYDLNSIVIERGALNSLKKFRIKNNLQLMTVSSGIQHLQKLE
ncbi:P-loop containing nucleoside triphosphate hydrolase, partial [Sesbania bispinosa]